MVTAGPQFRHDRFPRDAEFPYSKPDTRIRKTFTTPEVVPLPVELRRRSW
jgi:hypothetical protein